MSDPAARETAVARTAHGVLNSLKSRLPELAGATAAQYAAALRLTAAVDAAYDGEYARVRSRLDSGAVLAGDALKRWHSYPLDCTAGELLDALVESLGSLLLCAVTAADERVDEAWRREPAAEAAELTNRDPALENAEHRIGMAVRRWRRVLEEYAEESVRDLDKSVAPDTEVVSALVATVLLGGRRAGRRARNSPNGSVPRVPCGCVTVDHDCCPSISTVRCARSVSAASPPSTPSVCTPSPRPNSSPRCPYCRRRGDHGGCRH